MSLLVEVKGLCVRYNGKNVLDNVNLEIAEGETIGIIGRSGSGKTVLLNVLRGLDEEIPATGQVIYHVARCDRCGRIEPPSAGGKTCPKCGGRLEEFSYDILDRSDEKAIRDISVRTAIMIQRTFGIYGDDSVIENVLKALSSVEYNGDRVARAADLIDSVRLSHRMMHIARDLSGGEKQRVVLARQLAKEPMMLLADEPTGTLDPRTATVVHDCMKSMSRDLGITIMITSHFPEVIEELTTRAILMDEGRIVRSGPPAQVIKEFLQSRETIEKKPVETGEPIFRIRDLSKKYFSVDRGVINAVNKVTLDIKEGEIFGIVGTSGAGKTSLMSIMTGNLEPTDGTVEMRVGEDWVNMCEPGYYARGRAKPYIGLLYQEYDLYPHRTVIDNLTESIGLEFPAELAEKKAIHTLLLSGFTEERSREIMDKYPGELSEGERHRVSFARALIKEPHVIVLDEPTGTMDPITKQSVMSSMFTAREETGETFVVVSHDMDFVEKACDRVAYMKGGKIVAIGTPREILPVIKASYI
ncbi:methyl coenzyme M reductase system, component A2 [Methanocella arvoryzae]|uniref:ABC-type transport system, ATPase component n=1 Tax=Methanocella arvoryzae (strain DSM 22066 / NBRC 105507 / MRE50) TaxID=351160 RepID=Q0W827_METAR|nr:methyl coenzyme M reductase system, component A2 [Methanocella arvoryzae]CAJ35466.1 ABC-type transport system, ATPase component [Methanocella arvoryzae MRE50]